ncbi:MAG: HAD-IIIA family hydrolase [Moorea sp. SIO1F2]|uniref:D-glycero-alpha-D-manno-heptose-1,7-bisphosphate 7-phosphatase n=1 Tax=unclassified Moorena TaxID=2683338 RepID=UPI0013BBD8B2|nr:MULTISPECIES: HAD family hydrolase [unclassified Moorena]NEN94796.1 HAD-IIIA family hydrolase [Moorena sp. SIO3I7]NEO44061.1 HAD-IIIA family hydrolase [Moorena sp. SIO4A3]NEO05751.1 HAD-IIIA family hydrolase [Moorena sp. SIO3I8]NEO22861.1 HAD-IIIA family hydrolase [Moorena sp. SIO4A5]NEP25078.1 HAD-IIIA family hydrolase [Moorena sp. SIO3I6]
MATQLKLKPAIFLDRDGTLIKHVHHLCNPEDVELEPTAVSALSLLREAGFACVVVTNQSVVGRGMLSLKGLESIHARLEMLLHDQGIGIDAIYYCPHVPQTSDLTQIEHIDRKPGPGMLLRAAQEMGLSISQSWMIGDSISDVLAGANAGCKGSCLIQSNLYRPEWTNAAEVSYLASDLLDAVKYILHASLLADSPDEIIDAISASNL